LGSPQRVVRAAFVAGRGVGLLGGSSDSGASSASELLPSDSGSSSSTDESPSSSGPTSDSGGGPAASTPSTDTRDLPVTAPSGPEGSTTSPSSGAGSEPPPSTSPSGSAAPSASPEPSGPPADSGPDSHGPPGGHGGPGAGPPGGPPGATRSPSAMARVAAEPTCEGQPLPGDAPPPPPFQYQGQTVNPVFDSTSSSGDSGHRRSGYRCMRQSARSLGPATTTLAAPRSAPF
jgi:hypothetical protein